MREFISGRDIRKACRALDEALRRLQASIERLFLESEPVIKRTERGWPGHFAESADCLFRRNTLIENGEEAIVVSTVGQRHNGDGLKPLCGRRYYETMAFKAAKKGFYIDADFLVPVLFDSAWEICADSPEKLPGDADSLADRMHEDVVAELSAAMIERSGTPPGDGKP